MDYKKTRLVVALDFDDLNTAKQFIWKTCQFVRIYKVGSVLFTSEGKTAIEAVQNAGCDVFLDLKFHDIPNTVELAVRSCCKLGVKMLTVHISGGESMLKAAIRGADEASKIYDSQRPLIIGVTKLTSVSSDSAALSEILSLAEIAYKVGIDGVVCSGYEVEAIKSKYKLFTVVPGIRLEGDKKQDQVRVVTPAEAARRGADFIVLGRTVTRSNDPIGTLKMISEEVESV
ncbi:MAG: orotidine-5'-phosphate decarboxylase [bacterium]